MQQFNESTMDLCEFIAENELIEILPTFKYTKQLNLISGDFGPFHPSIPVRVPLWMALNLHRQHKCTIITPGWIQSLPQLQETQENQTDRLVQMPSDSWREVLKLLENTNNTCVNCKQLCERREAILRMSAHQLFQVAQHKDSLFIGDVTLNNATRAELQLIKPVIQKSFQHLQRLRKCAAVANANKQLL